MTNYRNLLLSVLLFVAVAINGINVIPYPFEYSTNTTGCYKFNDTTAIVCRQKKIMPVAEIFANTVRQSTGLEIPFDKHSTHPIYLEIDKFITHPEYYYLRVGREAIEIYGGSTTAIYYGLQTLLQLLPAQIESPNVVKGIDWNVPEMVIEDFPKFRYRGMHIDPCRHFMPISHIKKQIDWMSKFKLNYLHMHLTDDQLWTIEIKHYPKLTEIGSKRKNADGTIYQGGYYTQDELKDLVAYASLRGVTIIPEIEMPGHAMAALAAYPEYGCLGGPYDVRSVWGIEDQVLCVGNKNVFQFIENILTEVADIFPGRYIHVGGDECPTDVWAVCPKCQALKKRMRYKSDDKLYGYFMKRIEEILFNLDRKMIGWDDILEGGVSKSSTIMCWHDGDLGLKTAKKGYDVILTPWNICYFDHYQGSPLFEPMAQGGYTDVDEIYSWSLYPDKYQNTYRPVVIGGQANVWSEYISTPEQAERMIYPRILALSETLWSHSKDSADFHERLDTNLLRLEYGAINYHIPLPEGPQAQYIEFIDTANITLSNSFNYPIYYALDDFKSFHKYDSIITIGDSNTLLAYSISPTGRHSDTIKVEYHAMQGYRSAVNRPSFHNGIYRQRSNGYYPNAHGIDSIVFDKEELVDSLIYDYRDTYKKPWIDVYNGYFNVDSTAEFYITTDVEELWVDGILIIDNNDMVKRCSRNVAVMCLEKGKHSFRIVYNNCVNDGFPAIWRRPEIRIKTRSESKYHSLNKNDLYR